MCADKMSSSPPGRYTVRSLPYFGGRISTSPPPGALYLAGHPQRTGEEIEVAGLQRGGLAQPQPRERGDGHERPPAARSARQQRGADRTAPYPVEIVPPPARPTAST